MGGVPLEPVARPTPIAELETWKEHYLPSPLRSVEMAISDALMM